MYICTLTLCVLPPFHAYADSPGKFSLKIHYGGQFELYPKTYVGGLIRYVDMCDEDEMGILEIGNMLEELGESGDFELSYKVPGSDFETGLFPLMSDVNVLQMCKALPPKKIMYVYEVRPNVPTQEYLPSQQYDLSFFEDPTLVEFEKEQHNQMNKEFTDVEHEVVPPQDDSVLQEELDDGSDIVSFHGDSSNMDSTDDDVTTFKNGGPKQNENHEKKGGDFGSCDFDVSTMIGFVTFMAQARKVNLGKKPAWKP